MALSQNSELVRELLVEVETVLVKPLLVLTTSLEDDFHILRTSLAVQFSLGQFGIKPGLFSHVLLYNGNRLRHGGRVN